MGVGPLVSAAGMLLLLRAGLRADYFDEIFPAIVVFGVGLAMTVAPLTATVLAHVSSAEAGIASAVNNAIARIAGLLGTAAVGTVLAGTFTASFDRRLGAVHLGAAGRAAALAAKHLVLGRPPVGHVPATQARALIAAANGASVESFHIAVVIAAALLIAGGLTGALGIERINPRVSGVAPPH
jgi:hypothetical protein